MTKILIDTDAARILIDTGAGRQINVQASASREEANISIAGVLHGKTYVEPIYAALPKAVLAELIESLQFIQSTLR